MSETSNGEFTPNEIALTGRLASENGELVKERDSLVRNSRASAKLDRRFAAGKDGDILAADADGTLYLRQNRQLYIGENQQTRDQLLTKNIPFLINTARPGWGDESDEDTVKNLGLPLPDIVIAGTGGMVYWRNHEGKLVTDDVHLAMLNEHQIGIRTGETVSHQQFEPRSIIEATYPVLNKYIPKGLTDVLIDPGPIGTNGEKGIDGVRFVARDMPYEEIIAMTGDIKDIVSGVKLQLSEITKYSTAEDFSGWIHLIPSAAGKDRALRYVLDTLSSVKGRKMTAHALGDTSIDIPMLAMGTPDETDKYTVKQYALSNLPERARAKLEKVSGSSANFSDKLSPHLHLTMLDKAGPDGVAEVVGSLK